MNKLVRTEQKGELPKVTDLDQVVAELGEVEHRAGWGRVERIAGVITRHFFDGDLEDLCTQSNKRSTSIRTLAAHPGCPLSKSQLHETLSAFVVYRTESVAHASKKLTPSHVALVARLPRQERQRLLERVAHLGMSVRELREATREVRRKRGEKRGRPPTSSVEKAITRLENAVLFLEEGTQLLSETPPSSTERQQLATLLDRAHELLRCATRNALELRKPGETEHNPPSRVRILHQRVG